MHNTKTFHFYKWLENKKPPQGFEVVLKFVNHYVVLFSYSIINTSSDKIAQEGDRTDEA